MPAAHQHRVEFAIEDRGHDRPGDRPRRRDAERCSARLNTWPPTPSQLQEPWRREKTIRTLLGEPELGAAPGGTEAAAES